MTHRTPDAPLARGEAGGGTPRRGERGFVIPITGLLLIPLVAFTALAIDVGAWYARGTELQRAVDMAAMAGVVWLPNSSKAQTEAQAALQRNGFSSSNASIVYTVVSENRYRVRATINAGRFFSGVVASGAQSLTRTSTAEFNKPVPMGSPLGTFGNVLSGDLNGDGDLNDAGECGNPEASCAGSQPQLWAAINATYEDNANGDPYATRCITGTGCSSITNGEYRPDGYTYAIEAQAGQVVTVQIYDAANNAGLANNYAEDSGAMTVQYEVFNEDGSALTNTVSPALSMRNLGMCASGTGLGNGRRAFPADYQPNTYHNRWWTLCRFTAPMTGIYPLRVQTSNIQADSSTGVSACSTTCGGSGWNGYSLRATVTTGPQPRLYGIGDMSIWNVADGSTANFYLAEVGPEHAGKRFILDMYDPGDGNSGTFTMEINGPAGADFPCTLRYGGTNGLRGDTSGGTENYGGQCRFLTRTNGNNRFNSRWVRVEIVIPTAYNCTTDCWWRVQYNFGTGVPTDRTVWAVQIVGDPVHLVE